MASTTSRRMFFVKGKKKQAPRANWMKEAQSQSARQDGGASGTERSLGASRTARPDRSVSLKTRLGRWATWLALCGLAITALAWFATAIMEKVDEQPTIAETIAKSRLSRGQMATQSGFASSGNFGRSNEESFIATHAKRGGGASSAAGQAGGAPASAKAESGAHPRAGECGVGSDSGAAAGASISDCLHKLERKLN